MIAQAVGLGIILSFLYTELIGLSAGGLIVPGYIAFFWGQTSRIIVTIIISLLTYGSVKLLSNYIILYSRRRFMSSVIIGYLLGWVFRSTIIGTIPISQDLRVIGYIVPGLIANCMIKQGILSTLISLFLISGIVRLFILFTI